MFLIVLDIKDVIAIASVLDDEEYTGYFRV